MYAPPHQTDALLNGNARSIGGRFESLPPSAPFRCFAILLSFYLARSPWQFEPDADFLIEYIRSSGILWNQLKVTTGECYG
jgi:hypothetical protein